MGGEKEDRRDKEGEGKGGRAGEGASSTLLFETRDYSGVLLKSIGVLELQEYLVDTSLT